MANEIVKIQMDAPVKNKATLQALLEMPATRAAMMNVVPKHVNLDRQLRKIMVEASKNPMIYECTAASVLRCSITMVELGLEPGNTLGQCYLIPFRNNKERCVELTFMPGYRGLVDLARRSGEIRRIEAQVVYDQDMFDLQLGLDQRLVHVPYMQEDRKEDKKHVKCVYAVAELTDGSKQLEVMTTSQIEGIRKRSRSGESGPWVTDWAEMARKTVVRRIFKYLPVSVELAKNIMKAHEQEDDFNGIVTLPSATEDLPPLEPPKRRSTKALEQKAEEPEAPTEPPTESEETAGQDTQPESEPSSLSPLDALIDMASNIWEMDPEAAHARLKVAVKPKGITNLDELPADKLKAIAEQVLAGKIKKE